MRLCCAAFSRSILGSIALATAIAAPAPAQGFAPGFHVITPPAGTVLAVFDLSRDGTTIGGAFSPPTSGISNGFTFNGDTFTAFPSTRPDISSVIIWAVADGGAACAGVAGTNRGALGYPDGFYQAQGGEPQYLVPLSESYGITMKAISGDGLTAVGNLEQWSPSGPLRNQPAIYTRSGGVQYLPRIPTYGGTYTEALGVSRDGRVVFGGAQQWAFDNRVAWTWTQQGGYQVLPPAVGVQDNWYYANASNDDGSILVGYGEAGGLRWVNGQAQILAAPGYRYGVPTDVSNDGSIITGVLYTIDTNRPVEAVWTEPTGWVPLMSYLQSHGIAVPGGITFNSDLICVSSDGLTFAGTGNVSFVIRVPSPAGLGAMLAVLAFRVSRQR